MSRQEGLELPPEGGWVGGQSRAAAQGAKAEKTQTEARGEPGWALGQGGAADPAHRGFSFVPQHATALYKTDP